MYQTFNLNKVWYCGTITNVYTLVTNADVVNEIFQIVMHWWNANFNITYQFTVSVAHNTLKEFLRPAENYLIIIYI